MSHTDEPEKGSFYLLDRDLSVTKKMERVSISNGLTWSLDNRILYFIDTPTFTVAAFDFDRANAEITNKRIAIRVPENNGSPDGMTIDSEGMLWIAHWNGLADYALGPFVRKKNAFYSFARCPGYILLFWRRSFQ
jgi:sugar lactone lactonase YvrE